MAAMTRGCLFKFYELTYLSSGKGKTPHQRSLERFSLRQDSPREDSSKGVHVWLHLDESLTDGDKAGDM